MFYELPLSYTSGFIKCSYVRIKSCKFSGYKCCPLLWLVTVRVVYSGYKLYYLIWTAVRVVPLDVVFQSGKMRKGVFRLPFLAPPHKG